MSEVGGCPPHCQGSLDAGRGTTFASSTTEHWWPHLQGCQATFRCHTSHQGHPLPTSPERWGPLLVWEVLGRELPHFLLRVCACPVAGPFHYWGTQCQDEGPFLHPGAKSLCCLLTVGWRPNPASGIYGHQRHQVHPPSQKHGLKQATHGSFELGLTHTILPDPMGYTVGRRLTNAVAFTLYPQRNGGCGLSGAAGERGFFGPCCPLGI